MEKITREEEELRWNELVKLFNKSNIKNSISKKLSDRVLIYNRDCFGNLKHYCVTVHSCKKSQYEKEKELLKPYWYLSYEEMKIKLQS